MTWVYDPDHNKPITPKQAQAKFQKAMSDLLAGKNPGPQSFRLKPTKKASETYPLKLTQTQRESLCLCTRLSLRLKKRIEAVGEGMRRELVDAVEPSGGAEASVMQHPILIQHQPHRLEFSDDVVRLTDPAVAPAVVAVAIAVGDQSGRVTYLLELLVIGFQRFPLVFRELVVSHLGSLSDPFSTPGNLPDSETAPHSRRRLLRVLEILPRSASRIRDR